MTKKAAPYISLVLAASTVIILATALLMFTSNKPSPLPVKSITVKTILSPTPDIFQLYQTGSTIMGLKVVSVAPKESHGTIVFKGEITLTGTFVSPNCIVKFDTATIPRITAVLEPSLCLTSPKATKVILDSHKTGDLVTITIDDLSANATDGNYTATLVSVLK